MTFQAWLERATGGLPREVAERVEAEYAAHIAESGLPEAEAVAALGDPRAVRRALGRTYMNWEQLESLRDGRGLGLIQPLIWGLPPLYGLGLVLIYADGPAPAFPYRFDLALDPLPERRAPNALADRVGVNRRSVHDVVRLVARCGSG
ncbi:hypothetical protein SAMN04488058_102120 [Deinococcus reticulitermitis]|uniref:Uncharacterized protein n=1 Tax=Deinococcus reticulitermitis TaxID=856736 RepID=A0A1H6UE80_9DEIO|nr:hypothetical protein [Deinococcus reticulitermitis]SEI87977.1 hypothetical protein SAMN04488058_102120 [Deinococcus reticulitermitis]